jgi:hypothetical protein
MGVKCVALSKLVSIVTVARNEAQASVDNACKATAKEHDAIESLLNCACIAKR